MRVDHPVLLPSPRTETLLTGAILTALIGIRTCAVYRWNRWVIAIFATMGMVVLVTAIVSDSSSSITSFR